MGEQIEPAVKNEDEKPTRKKGGEKGHSQDYQNEEAADKRARAEINTGRGSGTHNR